MAARIAKSLAALRSEFNAAFPHRATGRDGWIGDPAHQARASRHNPNKFDVVCGLDMTHDPASGADVHKYARLYVATVVRLGNEAAPDFEYVISNRQVASREQGWAWRAYKIPKGGDPHEEHAHFAVGRGPDSEPTPPYDDVYSWHVADLLLPAAPVPVPEEDAMPARFIQYTDPDKGAHIYCVEGRIGVHVTHEQTLKDNKANVEGPFNVAVADTLWLVDGPLANRTLP